MAPQIDQWRQNVEKSINAGLPFFSIFFRASIFDPFLSSFGSPLAPFGSPLSPFGSLLAPFGSLLAPFWHPLAPFWHVGSLWLPFCYFWLIFDSFWELKTFKNQCKNNGFEAFSRFLQKLKKRAISKANGGRFWDPLRNPMGSKIRSGSAEGPSRACQHGFRHLLFPYLALHPTSHHLFFCYLIG